MKKLIALVSILMVALFVLSLSAVAEESEFAAVIEAPIEIEVVVIEQTPVENETVVEVEIEAEIVEEADEVVETAEEIQNALRKQAQQAQAVAVETVEVRLDTVEIIEEDTLDTDDADVEIVEEEALVEIDEHDVEGLEIVIIEDAAEEEEVSVEIEDDEDGETMELTMEDDAVPLAGPAMVAIDRQVNVRSSLGSRVNENETVTLTGELIGFDGCDVMVQWQVFDGANWLNIDGATDMEYSFAATSESVNSSYRLAVAINA